MIVAFNLNFTIYCRKFRQFGMNFLYPKFQCAKVILSSMIGQGLLRKICCQHALWFFRVVSRAAMISLSHFHTLLRHARSGFTWRTPSVPCFDQWIISSKKPEEKLFCHWEVFQHCPEGNYNIKSSMGTIPKPIPGTDSHQQCFCS